jgi:hypothetical protein
MLIEIPLSSSALVFPILECFHIVGFVISVGKICVILMLFSSNPDNHYLNYAFDLKMVFFVSAIIFNYMTHRRVLQSDAFGPGRARRRYFTRALELCRFWRDSYRLS